MKNIIFRGKSIETGLFIQGYLFKMWRKTYILWGSTNGVPNMIEVVPETVGQYSGCNDVNDVHIFEGDIVRYEFLVYATPRLGAVVYSEKHAGFVIKGTNYLPKVRDKVEVAGNIYDNPQLL
jgi:hypothetical protein